ncbi:hypothetical protein BDN70DRAFT_876788 [Pholiota conissans]|uniref:Uncharacterized protein n=1 Tax=Pholiota conissans TaxID=109636 RepID=A0A9P5Z4Q7_9AGAR|nr:hypothetical protein BDN70DRAFT_876788 [Pholiota conissans]
MAASHLKAAPPQGQRIRQRIQAVQLQFWSQLFRGRRLGERQMSTSTALPPVRKTYKRRDKAQIPVLHTLRPDTIVSRREKVHDFSEMAGPLLRTANQGKCQLPYVLKHIKTGKASHIPYPSNTRGYLYYHVPQGRSELAGGIRFRLCEGPEDFERGRDLYTPSGQPWGYTLPELATVKRCKPLLALILTERFVDETMIHDLSKLNLRGRYHNKALNIYTLTDPFVFDLAAGRKPCTVRILTRKKVVMVNFSAQEFAGSHDGTRNRVYPLTGLTFSPSVHVLVFFC